MVMRIIIIGLIIVGFVGIFGNLLYQGNMSTTIQNVQTSLTTVAYAGEFEEIQIAVDEFLKLRSIRGTDEGDRLAERLDLKLNSLELVKIYCDEKISTLELSYESNPYEKLQEICPKLKTLSFSKAVELFRLI